MVYIRSSIGPLTGAFIAFNLLTSSNAAASTETPELPDMTVQADCTGKVALSSEEQPLAPNHIESLAVRIGCELQNKENAEFKKAENDIRESNERIHGLAKLMQEQLNRYQSENPILSVLPSLAVDGKMEDRTVEILMDYVRDYELYEFFIGTLKYEDAPAEKIYMKNFRNFIMNAAPVAYAANLRNFIQNLYDQKAMTQDFSLIPDIDADEFVDQILESLAKGPCRTELFDRDQNSSVLFKPDGRHCPKI